TPEKPDVSSLRPEVNSTPSPPTPGEQACSPRISVRWRDPYDVENWLAAVGTQVRKALAAGQDATLPIRECVLSRYEARRRIRAAGRTLTTLLEAGERSLRAEMQSR